MSPRARGARDLHDLFGSQLTIMDQRRSASSELSVREMTEQGDDSCGMLDGDLAVRFQEIVEDGSVTETSPEEL